MILFLLGANDIGGAERSMLAVAKGLQRKGFSVQLAVYGRQRELLKAHCGSLDVIDLGTDRTFATLLPLYRLLRQTRPSVLITALRYTNMLGILVAAYARSRTRVIVTEHSPMAFQPGRKQRILRPLIGWIYPMAGAVVAVSQGIADGLAMPVRLIHNPSIPDTLPDAAPVQHAWFEDTVPVVMAIGRLSAEKDFATLLDGFAKLVAHTPARLVILGDGVERQALEEWADSLDIREQVLFAGVVPNVYVWLKHASLFVSASRFEGFGNAIVEAMACRVPVVATDCPVGPAEILEQGRFGRLVEVGDADALSRAMLEMLAQKTDVEAAYQRSLMFSEGRCVDAYADLIKGLG